jgi:hypothetical protein
MRRLIIAFIALLATALPVGAQRKPDEENVRKLPQAFCAAFNTRPSNGRSRLHCAGQGHP